MHFRNFLIVLAYFSINLTNPALIFRVFGRKTQFVGNFEQILKIFDENSMEKWNFYFIFIFIQDNLLLKIEPSEITPFFFNNFFGFGGGGFPLPRLATPLLSIDSVGCAASLTMITFEPVVRQASFIGKLSRAIILHFCGKYLDPRVFTNFCLYRPIFFNLRTTITSIFTFSSSFSSTFCDFPKVWLHGPGVLMQNPLDIYNMQYGKKLKANLNQKLWSDGVVEYLFRWCRTCY